MSKQLEPKRTNWHKIGYVYHEAGHAVVGHVLGWCLGQVVLLDTPERGSKGYCLFLDAERQPDVRPWQRGGKYTEQFTVLSAGTLAMKRLCYQRGWQYERWRGYDTNDFDAIYWRSLECVADEDERSRMQRGCIEQAQAVLEQHWPAVEALAAVLLTQGGAYGREAHWMIQDAIDPTYTDWRMELVPEKQDGALSEGGVEVE
jgi:hypothetical protein